MNHSICRVVLAVWLGVIVMSCQREEPAKENQLRETQVTETEASPTPELAEMKKTPQRATTQTKFRVVFVSGLGSLPAYAARQRGWYEERGFKVSFGDGISDSSACLDLLETGGADVAYGVSLQSLLEADRKNLGALRILGFAAETTSHPIGAFLIPKGSAISQVEDLKDVNVAAAGGDFASRMAELVITGGERPESKEIPLIEISAAAPFDFSGPDSPDGLFAVGEVMAGLTKGMPEDRAARTLETAPAAKAFFSPFPVQVVVMRADLLAQDPEGVNEFAEANGELLTWCNESFAEMLPILQDELGLDDESTLNLFAPLFLSPGELTVDQLLRAAELWSEEPLSQEQRSRIPKLVYPNAK